MEKNKRGVSWLIWVLIVLFLGAIIVVISLLILFKAPTKVSPIENFTNRTDVFRPYNISALGSEDRIVYDSLTAFIDSINYLVGTQSLQKQIENKDLKKPIDLGIKNVNIYYVGKIELEEAGKNSYRLWMFNKSLEVKNSTPNVIDSFVIFSDYRYGFCSYSGLKDSGDCLDIDKPNSRKVRKDVKTDIAAVRDIVPLYNIMMEVEYNDGRICKISTTTSTEIGEMVKEDSDLLVWGAPTVCSGGCDRNGDGVRGYYFPKDYGKDYTKVHDEEELSRLDQALISIYFPDGKVSKISSQGCLDSPTWLECPGVRVFYCGKWGYTKWAEKESEYYYIVTPDGELHSRAGAKFYILFDEKLKADDFGDGVSSINKKGSDKIEIRDSKGKKILDFAVSSKEYAKKFYEPIYTTAFSTIPIMGYLIYGNLVRTFKGMDDPIAFCYGGYDYGSDVKAKCDDFGCVVCNFQLPQEDISSNWIAGYGDPKYLVYYEAFPEGEEQAWQIDWEQTTIGSIVMWNLAVHVAMPIGGSVIKKTARATKKIFSFFRFSTIKKARKFISARPAKAIAKWYDNGRNAVKSFIEYFKTPKNLIIATKKGNIKFTKPLVKEALDSGTETVMHISKRYFDDVLKAAGKTWPEYIDDVAKGNKEGLRLIAQTAEELGVLKKGAGSPILKGITKKGKEAVVAAIIVASSLKEDSINEKYMPVGVNALGMKNPYYGAYKTGEDLTPLDEKANAYFIALVRDKYGSGIIEKLLLNQPLQRFYLASPCKADLVITRTRCECYAPPEKYGFKVMDQNYKRLVGDDEDLIVVDPNSIKENATLVNDKYRYAIKYCLDYSEGFGSIIHIIEKPVYKPRCIKVNPIIKEGTFCYGGNHAIEEISQITLLLGNVAAGIGTEAIAVSTQTATGITVVLPVATEAVQTVVDIGIDVITLGLETLIAKQSKWPNH